eukprot:SAG22_NODE_5346_length_1032_cov_2.546624_1_plen_106_part_00
MFTRITILSCHQGQVLADADKRAASRDCYLMCGHTFARANIEAVLNDMGKILPAIPGTQRRTHGWYAPCPTCRHLFGECEIKTLFPTFIAVWRSSKNADHSIIVQ